MNIFILTSNPFPIGMASTNRIISYATGLQENNVNVKVICLRPIERIKEGILNKKVMGKYNGIEYEYPSGTTVRPETFIKRRIINLKGILKTISIISKKNKKDKVDAIILFSNDLVHIIVFFILTRLLSLTYIQEKSEFPSVYLKHRKFLGPIYSKLYTSYVYKAFDSIFVITKSLEKYFLKKIRKKSRLLHVPMIVELSRFHKKYPNLFDFEYIAYCGSLGGNKDGVQILIEAFSIISNKFSSIKLCIIGNSHDRNELQNLEELTRKFNIEDRVIFTGKIKREKIPKYICNATLLALARPTSIQAKGGFPTKLGEYLATGNPVVVTKVGEIPNYLEDGKSAFIAEPDSVEAFAEKIDFALSKPRLAKKIGLEGRKVAQKCFDYKNQAIRIINFINEINQQRIKN